MGDRCNFGFQNKGEDTAVFLYSHWGGYKQLSDLAIALEAAKPRWGDDQYATRICISQIIGDEWNSETGFGIWVGDKIRVKADNQVGQDVLVVNWGAKIVEVYNENFVFKSSYTLQEFIDKYRNYDGD